MTPSFDLEILGVLNASILSIWRNIGGAIAPPAPPVPPPLVRAVLADGEKVGKPWCTAQNFFGFKEPKLNKKYIKKISKHKRC